MMLWIENSGRAQLGWKRLWCWERLKIGGEGMTGWDGCMASLIQWTWVWANWEIVKDREAWYAAVQGVKKSQSDTTEWLNNDSLVMLLCWFWPRPPWYSAADRLIWMPQGVFTPESGALVGMTKRLNSARGCQGGCLYVPVSLLGSGHTDFLCSGSGLLKRMFQEAVSRCF